MAANRIPSTRPPADPTRCCAYTPVLYGERVDGDALRGLIAHLEAWLPIAETSLASGRRLTGAARLLTPRGLNRRRAAVQVAHDMLATARERLATLEDNEAWLRRQLEGLGEERA